MTNKAIQKLLPLQEASKNSPLCVELSSQLYGVGYMVAALTLSMWQQS